MPKKQNKAIVEKKDGKMELSPQHVNSLKNVEQVGTAMMQTAQEYTIAIEEILVKDFGFTEEQLQHMEGRLREMLATLADVERKGLSILSFTDMEAIGQIAEMRFMRLKGQDSGIVLPPGVDTKKLKS